MINIFPRFRKVKKWVVFNLYTVCVCVVIHTNMFVYDCVYKLQTIFQAVYNRKEIINLNTLTRKGKKKDEGKRMHNNIDERRGKQRIKQTQK